MRFFIKIFILLCSLDSFAQFDWDSKNWNKESLGFGCSVDGQMTKPVLNINQLLMEKGFDEIRQLLNSDLPADQFLATFVLEKLNTKKELKITSHELERIKEIKNSNEMVPFCSGCTLWIEIPLKALFDEEKRDVVFARADTWFDTYYKFYYQKSKSKRDDN